MSASVIKIVLAIAVDGELPPSLRTEMAAIFWDISPDHLWSLARAGEAPVQPLRLGRALRWPTALVLASLGIDVEAVLREAVMSQSEVLRAS